MTQIRKKKSRKNKVKKKSNKTKKIQNVKKHSTRNILDDIEIINKLNSFETKSCGSIYIHSKNKEYKRYFGHQSKNVKINKDTQFRIFSLTKPICAIVILLLVDKNQIKLTDTINKFGLEMIPHSNKITIIQLLNHMSGIYDVLETPYKKETINAIYQKNTPNTIPICMNFVLHTLQNKSPTNKPNKTFKYNNLGYDLLGHIVEYITNKPVNKYIEMVLFKPLNIKNYSFHNTSYHKNMAFPLSSVHPYKNAILEEQNTWGLNACINISQFDYIKLLRNYNKLLSKKMNNEFNKLYFNFTYNGVHFMDVEGAGDFNDITKYDAISVSNFFAIPKQDLFILICQNYVDNKHNLRDVYNDIIQKILFDDKPMQLIHNKFW
jgi:CubicO group peptidase (beta-lactamase class C family)